MPSTATSLEPDVALPRAVRERVKRVNDRIRERTESQDPAPAEPTPPTEASEPPAVTSPENPSPSEPTPAIDPRENDPQYWKQRFNVTAGMLRREREDRARSEAEKDQVIADLRRELQSLKSSAAQAPEEIDLSAYFTPEQIEQFGEDQCRTTVRAALKAAQNQVQAAIQAELEPLREREARRAQHSQQLAKQAFTDKLAELVPDFEEIDADPQWHAWLAEEDPETGLERQELLARHARAYNAQRVARMFEQFKKSKEPARQPVVAPNASGAPGSHVIPSVGPKKGRPTDEEIRDFYKRAATKRPGQPGYVTEQERAEFEARLQASLQAS